MIESDFSWRPAVHTMRYPPAETAEKHERILQHASRLFRERGFDGVSVAEIMNQTGLTHGPFYSHFASKESLMAESLQSASRAALDDLNLATQSPEQMRAYVVQYLSFQHRDSPSEGCVMPSLGAEVSRTATTKPAMTEHLRQMISKLTNHFPWSSKRNRRRTAIRLVSAMVGAQVLARAINDDGLVKEIFDSILSEYT